MSINISNSRNTVAIIGGGLVGSAVLRELVQGWVCGKREQMNTCPDSRFHTACHPEIKTIHITTRSEASLSRQLWKIKDFLVREEDVRVEQAEPLKLALECGPNRLRIEAELLDIVPEGLGPSTVDDESFRKASALYSYLAEKRPETLILGVNLASVASYHMKEIQNAVLAWVPITLKEAADEFGIETVALIGTTALGGMGTNMVWTHQSSQQMDSNLVNKILAAYGILGIMDRIHQDSDSTTRWVLLTPGSLLGYDYLDSGPVRYFSLPEGLPEGVEEPVRKSCLKVPLYEPLEFDLSALSNEQIPWEERRVKEVFLSGAKIKCGESGEYSPLQFACLSHAFQMGFNTDVFIARILMEELMGKSTGYNQIPLGSGKVIEPTARGQLERPLVLKRFAEMELETGIRAPPVYPALGSTRTQKEIVLADLLYRLLKERFGEPTLRQISAYSPEALAKELWEYLQTHPQLFAEITAVIPVISPGGKLCTGPYVMYLKKGVSRASDLAELANKERFRDFAALGAVDLRPAGEQLSCGRRIYETGVEILIKRAWLILDKYAGAFPSAEIDQAGSSTDPRVRHWKLLSSESQTAFDPVFFVVQFLGGERPYV
ncbi:TPA: hypothetical protein HA351_05070 [Methanosarcinaceae archaeon]|nr:hypothetical protein [Methanosarcinaceae archaeon]